MKKIAIVLVLLLLCFAGAFVYLTRNSTVSSPLLDAGAISTSVTQVEARKTSPHINPVPTSQPIDALAAKDREIARLQSELFKHLRPHEKYEKSAPDDKLTAQFSKLIDPALDPFVKRGLVYDAECRGTVCKLHMLDKDGNLSLEADSSLSDVRSLREITKGVMKTALLPTKDPRTSESLTEYISYYETYEEGAESGWNKLRGLWQAARSSKEMQDCLSNTKGQGEIEISISGHAGKNVSFSLGGTNTDSALDACVRKVLESYISGQTFSENESDAVISTTIVVPAT